MAMTDPEPVADEQAAPELEQVSEADADTIRRQWSDEL
jgi:hypothetical protein